MSSAISKNLSNNQEYIEDDISYIYGILDQYYQCPVCSKISNGLFYNQKYTGGSILKTFGLLCNHRFNHIIEEHKIDFVVNSNICKVFISFETKNKFGVTTEIHVQRAHSFIQWFLSLLSTQQTNGTVSVNVITTTGTNLEPIPSVSNFQSNGGANQNSLGIVVGTGTTANTPSTYELTAILTSGTAAGELVFGSDSFLAPIVSGNNVSIVQSKQFSNTSGGSITINEVGIHANVYNGTITPQVLIIRDVLTSPITVANSSTTTATYSIQITVS